MDLGIREVLLLFGRVLFLFSVVVELVISRMDIIFGPVLLGALFQVQNSYNCGV